jgi:hypothetical protein
MIIHAMSALVQKRNARLAAAAPPLIIGGAIGLGIVLLVKWLLSDDDKKKKLETVPANAETEFRRKEAETAVFRPIPAEIPAKPAAAPVPAVIPPFSVSVPAPQKIVIQAPPPPIKKKFVTREDLANIFHHGARLLNRTAAVAALKNLGFGKTAAYDALSPDGRFSDWLQIAPDGIIAWTDR